jgi:hypothetical protein
LSPPSICTVTNAVGSTPLLLEEEASALESATDDAAAAPAAATFGSICFEEAISDAAFDEGGGNIPADEDEDGTAADGSICTFLKVDDETPPAAVDEEDKEAACGAPANATGAPFAGVATATHAAANACRGDKGLAKCTKNASRSPFTFAT